MTGPARSKLPHRIAPAKPHRALRGRESHDACLLRQPSGTPAVRLPSLAVPAAGCSEADRWSADRRQAPDGGSAHVMSENFVQAREEGARQAPAPTPAQVRRKARKDEDFAGKQRARRHRLGRVFGAFRAATVAATRQRALGSRARDVMLSPAAAALATRDAARVGLSAHFFTNGS